MDPTLLVTIGIIFLATLVGSVLRSLRKDRCLQDFDGFHVTVERKDKRRIWGTMRLEATGFELEYRQNVVDSQMHVETSYALYKGEYEDMRAYVMQGIITLASLALGLAHGKASLRLESGKRKSISRFCKYIGRA